MKKKLVNGSELAKMRKPDPVSKQAVNKNKNLPFIMEGKDKYYDLTDPVIKKWLKSQPLKPTKKAAPKVKKKAAVIKKVSKSKVKPKPAKKSVNKKTVKKKAVKKPAKKKIPTLGDIPDHLKKLADSGQLTFAKAMTLSKYELECIKLYEQIKEIKVKADDKRGLSIDRRLIKTVFSKIYEIEMNQLLPLKEKLIPDLSAIYGVKNEKLNIKAGKKLDDEIWKILGNIKIELNKFLKKCGEGEI